MAFTHPGFLVGLLGIAIPIIIHLFELRRPQRVLFSNVEFIKQVQLVTARQRKLKHLLILVCRVLLVSCLVLVFAQPYIPAPEQSAILNSSVQVVVDASPSMQQQGGNDQALLEQAVLQAAELPLAFPPAARFWLWPGNKEPLSAVAYREAVEQVQVNGQAEPVGTLLRQAQAQRGGQPGPLFVFSDFQKSNFSTSSFAALDSAQRVFLVPLTAKYQANVFVDSVWVDDAFIRQGADVTLHIRLKNGGQEPAATCGVKLLLGSQQAAAFQATVPAGQTTVTQVRIRLQGAEAQLAQLQLDDYPVDFDNTYYFTLQPAAQIRVVELSETAALDRLYANEPLFAYQHFTSRQVNYQDINSANLLVIRELASLSAGLQDNLRRAVQQGATLVIVPPVATNERGAYTQFFRALGVGPMQWQPALQQAPVLQQVAAPSTQNTFFKDVFAGINVRAGMPKAAPVLRWSRSGTDVLRMRDGDNYLSGFPSGAGSVYVFAAPFSEQYSDFARHPLFVPVMYRLGMLSYQQEHQPAYRLTQSSIRLRLPKSTSRRSTETVYQLVQDSIRVIPGQQEQGGSLRLDLPAALRLPGFYRLERGGKVVATLAFNVDKRESDLRSYTATELRQMLGNKYPNVQVYEASAGQTIAGRYKATQVGTPLWRYFVWGALACLLLEGILLRWPRRQAVPAALAA
ncbi:BatA domain-containing protein [Hymenobacter sp. UYP22]|uniref:BatA domain-containing protein n=1 Tax=Hymenobacter sp. UYP22 TaxID=3156348 RepID=UPI00339A8E94